MRKIRYRFYVKNAIFINAGRIGMLEELINKIGTTRACIAVIGLGRIGLPIAALFANAGYHVIGVDVREDLVKAISSLKISLKEPSIEKLIKKVVKNGKLKTITNILEATKLADIIIICVQTPLTEKKEPNLTYLQNSCEDVAKSLSKGKLIIVESTVPPWTTKNLVAKILEEKSKLKCGKDFWLVHCPERMAPGKAIQGFIKNARIVGGFDTKSAEVAAELLRKVTKGRIIVTDSTCAEAAKLAENTFRDVNIAFANELALLCEKVGVDVSNVIKLANTHPRVNIHLPGAGVGGPCIPKDPYLLVHSAKDMDFDSKIILASRYLNDYMPLHAVELVVKSLASTGRDVEKSRICILGTAYKGEVSDSRLSPSKEVIKQIMKLRGEVTVYDPYCKETFGAKAAENLHAAAKGADCIVIMTDHPEFKKINLSMLKNLMNKKPIIVDGRRIIDPAEAEKFDFIYVGLGYGKRENL